MNPVIAIEAFKLKAKIYLWIGVAIIALILIIFILMAAVLDNTAGAGEVTLENLDDTEAQVAQFLLNKGLEPIHVAAIMGNIQKESGFDSGIEEREPNRHGTRGFGLLQWTNPGGGGGRRSELFAFADSQGVEPANVNMQMEFLWSEMTREGIAFNYTSNQWPSSRPYSGFLQATDLNAGRSENNPAYYFGRWFLRPDYQRANWDFRIRRAQHFYNAITTGNMGTEIIDSTAPGACPSGGLTWPVPDCHRISSPFGNRPNPFGGGTQFHNGIDISCGGINGQPIVASGNGTVMVAGWVTGYGNYVRIDHGGGIHTYYAHMLEDSIAVRVRDQVTAGQRIGAVGTTGASTGPHLHWTILVGGQAVNPCTWRR